MKAPWKDFDGNDIYEGDTIVHPSGAVGTVVTTMSVVPSDKWLVDYGMSGPLSRLCLQIGEKGRAVVRQRARPWPVGDVLSKLVEATNILLKQYDYDGDGWEQIAAARDAAVELISGKCKQM